MNGLVCKTRLRVTLGVASLAAVLLLGTVPVARAGSQADKGSVTGPEGRIQFTIRVEPADPFDPAYEASAKPKAPLTVRRGGLFRVTIHGSVKPGYHTYALIGLPEQSVISKLRYAYDPAFAPLWPVRETGGVSVKDPAFGMLKEHTSDFSWSQDVLVRPDAKPGRHTLKVNVDSQVCNESNCLQFNLPLEAAVEVSSAPALPVAEGLQKRAKEPPPSYARLVGAPAPAPPVQPTPAAQGEKKAVVVSTAAYLPDNGETYKKTMLERLAAQFIPFKASGGDSDLLAFVLAGIFWGAVSLITPCVFPMIPITVSFFLKQSEKEHHRPVAMALVYCATIVIVLTLAAVALISTFQILSRSPWLNFGLGALFIFFALSLFGMYEIELPSGLARFTSEREGKGGMIGTVFMALTFTIISFACVAPFLGGFGGTAGTVQRPWWHTVLGGLAFSITFAAPFFFLALFPTLLKKMPKSGSWLNSVKVVMGFLELAAALKFLRAGELLNTAAPSFFTYDFVLGLYVALCFLCGLYLLNVYRLPHDTPTEHLSVPRLLFSLLFLALGFYLMPALFTHGPEGVRQRPAGTVYAWVDSFLLPESHASKDEPWMGSLEYAVQSAREHRRKTGQPKLVFVDFTGKS